MPGRRREKKAAGIAVFFFIVTLITALDQFTKLLILQKLSLGESLSVVPSFFSLTLVHNKGIAFGLFHQHPMLLFSLITASILVLGYLSLSSIKTDWISLLCFSLILGGAIGNWIDRLLRDAVIDFLDFHVWPVFNLADAAISIGVFLFIISRIFIPEKNKKAES